MMTVKEKVGKFSDECSHMRDEFSKLHGSNANLQRKILFF